MTAARSFYFADLMEAWGELRASVLVAIEPERLAAEPYPDEHRHDLRVKLAAMERQMNALAGERRHPIGDGMGGPGHQHHRARDGRQA